MIKNKTFIRYALYSLICVFLCGAAHVFGLFRIGGITPQYAVCAVIAIAMFESEKTGAVFGLVFGLLSDFSAGGIFGTNALVFMICGYLVGCLVSEFVTVNSLSCCLIVFGIILTVDIITLFML